MKDYTKFYIDGEWVSSHGGEVTDVINPATEKSFAQITLATLTDLDRAVAAARKSFASFSRTSRQERIDLLSSIFRVFARRLDDLADALVDELGAPRKFAKEKQAGSALPHLQTAIAHLKDYDFEHPLSARTAVRREPIGVVGIITPWNWPINQIMVKVIPALATGCTLVHKPSEVAPINAHILGEILHEAGVPKGVYNLVDGNGPVVGAAMAAHPGIDMISFTGSTAAGIDVAKRAADTVKRVHQELGGKSPNIILEDADLEKAIKENIYRLMLNSGQTCHAPTRMLVPAKMADRAKVIAKRVLETITYGDPHTDVYMGPVVSARQWERVQSLIEKGVSEGATVLAGGTGKPDHLRVGYYVKPTILADVSNSMTIARQEIFGPVLCMLAYETEDEAVEIANDTDYGLAAYVQSGSDDRAKSIADRLQAGMVYINGASEDPEAPFGGYKMSGNGREWGKIAFGEFLETKAITRTPAAA
jgi:aldehyde dehydrogenase (NAD+)